MRNLEHSNLYKTIQHYRRILHSYQTESKIIRNEISQYMCFRYYGVDYYGMDYTQWKANLARLNEIREQINLISKKLRMLKQNIKLSNKDLIKFK